ncbi:MAG: ADP-ribosylglycohydrolase family protein [Planctomycetota bacterium]
MKERFQAAILGAAIGDALGAPLEFMSREQIQIRHGVVRDYVGGGWLDLRPGQYTDETEMMRRVLESLLEKRGLDVADLAGRYLSWSRSGPKDINPTVRSTLAFMDMGVPLAIAARRTREEGGTVPDDNGIFPRSVPLGLLYAKDPKRAVESALAEARITHDDLRAASASATLSLLVAESFARVGGREDFVEASLGRLDALDTDAYNVLGDVFSKREEELRPSSTAVDTLEAALFFFLKSATFEEALVRAVNFGGDADGVGAVTGAIAGAFHGIEAIPDRWGRSLQDAPLFSRLASRLADLAEKSGGLGT